MTAIKRPRPNAFDYLPKPFDLPDLMKRVAKALEQRKSSPSRKAEPRPTAGADPEDQLPLIGKTPAMQSVYQVIAGVMNADLPILVSGDRAQEKA